MMTIRLFGAFRNLQSEPEIQIMVPESVKTIGELRSVLAQHFAAATLSAGSASASGFDAAGLLSKSAIANDREILQDTAAFSAADRLALLPPVSGG